MMKKIQTCSILQGMLLSSCASLFSAGDKEAAVAKLLPENAAEVIVSTWHLGKDGRHEQTSKKVLKGRGAERVLHIICDNKAELVDARDKVLRFRAGMGTYDGACLEIIVTPAARHAYYSLELSPEERETILRITNCDL